MHNMGIVKKFTPLTVKPVRLEELMDDGKQIGLLSRDNFRHFLMNKVQMVHYLDFYEAFGQYRTAFEEYERICVRRVNNAQVDLGRLRSAIQFLKSNRQLNGSDKSSPSAIIRSSLGRGSQNGGIASGLNPCSNSSNALSAPSIDSSQVPSASASVVGKSAKNGLAAAKTSAKQIKIEAPAPSPALTVTAAVDIAVTSAGDATKLAAEKQLGEIQEEEPAETTNSGNAVAATGSRRDKRRMSLVDPHAMSGYVSSGLAGRHRGSVGSRRSSEAQSVMAAAAAAVNGNATGNTEHGEKTTAPETQVSRRNSSTIASIDSLGLRGANASTVGMRRGSVTSTVPVGASMVSAVHNDASANSTVKVQTQTHLDPLADEPRYKELLRHFFDMNSKYVVPDSDMAVTQMSDEHRAEIAKHIAAQNFHPDVLRIALQYVVEELRSKYLPQFIEETFRLLYSELLLFRDLKVSASSAKGAIGNSADTIPKPEELLRSGQNKKTQQQ